MTAAPALAQNPSSSEFAFGVNGDFLLETIACDVHWSAMQTAMIAIMLSASSRPETRLTLRSCRHLLFDDTKITLLALRYAPEIGLEPQAAAEVAAYYTALGAAKRRLAPVLETRSRSGSNLESLRAHIEAWRRLAASAAKAVSRLQTATRGRLAARYAKDANILKPFLEQAANGDTRSVDSTGIIQPPRLEQRRRAARVAQGVACTLSLTSGNYAAVLDDVSREGLGVTCPQPIAKGERATVLLANGRKLGAIAVRRNGAHIGLELVEKLPASDPLFRPASCVASSRRVERG
ncbi:MAG: PilZ domain-containing protein [Roseiarcus sp.]